MKPLDPSGAHRDRQLAARGHRAWWSAGAWLAHGELSATVPGSASEHRRVRAVVLRRQGARHRAWRQARPHHAARDAAARDALPVHHREQPDRRSSRSRSSTGRRPRTSRSRSGWRCSPCCRRWSSRRSIKGTGKTLKHLVLAEPAAVGLGDHGRALAVAATLRQHRRRVHDRGARDAGRARGASRSSCTRSG